MDLVIVGGGAIGCLYGYYLGRAGHSVTIVDTDPDVVDSLREDGLGFLGAREASLKSVSYIPVRAESDAGAVERCDLALLTVKSSATAAAAKKLSHLVSAEVPLLSLQAGLGNIETICRIVPEKALVVGFTLMSGANLGNGRVRLGGLGTTYIGELDGTFSRRLSMINKLFQDSGIHTLQVKRIVGRLWSKVILYSAINPISAMLRVTNGCLVQQDESRQLMRQLLDEGCRVAAAHGIDLVYPDLWEELLQLCEQSRDIISPMLQDVINGHHTEIDAQCGMICRYGREKGVDTATHAVFVNLIKLIEQWKPDGERFC